MTRVQTDDVMQGPSGYSWIVEEAGDDDRVTVRRFGTQWNRRVLTQTEIETSAGWRP